MLFWCLNFIFWILWLEMNWSFATLSIFWPRWISLGWSWLGCICISWMATRMRHPARLRNIWLLQQWRWRLTFSYQSNQPSWRGPGELLSSKTCRKFRLFILREVAWLRSQLSTNLPLWPADLFGITFFPTASYLDDRLLFIFPKIISRFICNFALLFELNLSVGWRLSALRLIFRFFTSAASHSADFQNFPHSSAVWALLILVLWLMSLLSLLTYLLTFLLINIRTFVLLLYLAKLFDLTHWRKLFSLQNSLCCQLFKIQILVLGKFQSFFWAFSKLADQQLPYWFLFLRIVSIKSRSILFWWWTLLICIKEIVLRRLFARIKIMESIFLNWVLQIKNVILELRFLPKVKILFRKLILSTLREGGRLLVKESWISGVAFSFWWAIIIRILLI